MNEESLFAKAVELPEAERAAFLDRECPDPALRARVEALLAADAAPQGPLDAPADRTRTFEDPNATGSYRPAPTSEEAEGGIIAGRYKLRQKIGEGGMGTVWLADQIEPIKRKVAVKLIRAERGQSKTILARFEAERQAIALMDHPHIAKLLDAGTTERGAPFFVMELVKGIPLNDFCDQHRLTIPERLNLFMQICSAVQHAHQKGIIHRDLKPSNILVESHDGKPVPKVIDFGLAKATTGLQLSEQSLHTAFGSVMGTPLYMAPEQAGFNALDVDTRADVYALGVILYELLTGTTPLMRETLKKAAFDEMLRLIREQEAPTPSSRLSSSDSAPSVAANRQTEPKKLSRFVKGELDWIVLKALAKERDRRYETANGFAKDIERFLNHEPVLAGPPTAGYRLKKFIRRNRGPVIAASLVLLALVAGVIGTTIGFVRASRATEQERLAKVEADTRRQEAEAAAEKERLARQEAADRLTQIELINNSVFDIFTDFDIRKVKAGPDPVEYVLTDRLIAAGKKLDERAIHDPLVLANLRDRLGQTLLSLGRAQEAIEFLAWAHDTRQAKLGPDHPDTLTSMNNLAEGYRDAGQLAKALPLLEETLKLKKAKLGPDHPDTLTSMNNLAGGYYAAGQLAKALPLLEETLKLMKAKLGPDHPDTLTSMNNLAAGYYAAGQLAKALPLLEETLKLMKAKLDPDHPTTLQSMNNLALGYQAAGQLAKALPLLEETLKLRKAKLGADHPSTLGSMNNLAEGYRNAGQLAKALPLYEETLKLRKAKLGADHPDTLTSMAGLAAGYRDAGQLAKALPLLEETLKLMKAKLGPDHPDTLTSMNNLAGGYYAAGQLDKALPLFEETLKLKKAKLGPDHPHTLTSMNNLAGGYKEAGQLDKALPLFEEAAHGLEKRRFQHEHARLIIPNTIEAYEQARQFEQATSWRQKWLAHVKAAAGADSPAYAGELATLGSQLLKHQQWTDAEKLLRECLAIREKKPGSGDPGSGWLVFNTQSMLGGALLGQKKYAEAEPLLLKGYEGMKEREVKIPKTGGTELCIPEALDRLIELYTATNQLEEAKKYRDLRAKYPPPKEVAPMPKEKK
jgi:serine/threonine protein kinase